MNPKRKLVYDKYGGHCAYCGCTLESKWHMDHLIPVIRCLTTGKPTAKEHDNIDNLMPACPSCNLDKRSMPLESWRGLIANKVNVLNRDITVYKFAKRFGLVNETGYEVEFYFEKFNDKKN